MDYPRKMLNYFLKNRVRFFLLFIIVLAAFLRLWNFNFDADTSKPLSYDFLAKIKEVENVAFGDIFKPSSFRQPYFLIYSSALIFKTLNTLGIERNESFREALIIYMISFSVLTVFLVYFIGKTLFNKTVGLFSSLILAVAPINVVGSRYFKEDTPLMFFSVLAVLFMILLIKKKNKYFYFLSAVSIGLVISAKYSGILLFPLFLAIHFLFIRKELFLKNIFSKEIILSFFIIFLTFFIINPFALIDYDDFVGGFIYQVNYSQEGHHDETAIYFTDYYLGFYLLYAIIPGLSFLITLFLFGGAFLVFRKKYILAITVFIWVVFFYFVFEYSKAKPFPFFARYFHPIFPLLVVFAAYFIYKMLEFTKKNKLFYGITITLIVISLLIPFLKSVFITKDIKNDTRFIATDWIKENLPAGSLIYLDDKYYSPRPSEGKFKVKSLKPLTDFPLEYYRKKNVDFVIVNNFRYDRYFFSAKSSEAGKSGKKYYQRIFNEFEFIKEFRPSYSIQTYGFHNPIIKIYKVR